MRAFLGLAPDATTKLAIENWRNKAFPHFPAPVPAANFHVTLAFLGQVAPKQIDMLDTHISAMTEFFEFNVSLNQIGYWPKPKAFWLGCQNTSNEHIKLVKHLNKAANTVGLNLPKQQYVAHLTLARKCTTNPPAAFIAPNFNWKLKAFHLYESVSNSHGVAYHIRQTWPLNKTFAFSNHN